jgi:hypothetical protein
MYSNTPIYAFGGTMFTEDKDPRAQINEALNLWPMDSRRKIAARIRQEVENHYHKAPNTPIPLLEAGASGITWRFLFNLVIRGDFKGRRTPNYNREAAEG